MPPKHTSAHRRGQRIGHTYKRMVATNGYIQIWVGKEHHLADSKGCAYEHRVIAEEKIGRRLEPDEVVHHVNGDRQDNRPENLEVLAGIHEHNVKHRTRNFDLRLPGEDNPSVACECGCGKMFSKYDDTGRPRRYVSGHNPERAPTQEVVEKLLRSHPGRTIKASDLMAATGQTYDAANAVLLKMTASGKIVRVARGVYGSGGSR